jgi:hypothetical protein
MTNTHKFAPLLGKRIRVTQMNDNGTVGAHFIATDGFITVTLTAEIENGVEIITRNAFNQLCINEKQNPTFKRLAVDIEFCGVNPSLLSYVTNAKEYADYAGDIAGFTIPEGEIFGSFALEVWTGLSGALADTQANGYMLLPFVGKGNLDNIKVDGQNQVTFMLKAANTRGGHLWGRGPYDVVSGVGTSEVQTIQIAGVPTGGTYTLSFSGRTTAPIALAATPAQIQAALELLPNVEPGDIVVSGGPLPALTTFTFANWFSYTNVPQMAINVTGLTGGAPVATALTTVPGVAGSASILPTPIDAYDHFLLIDSSVVAPVVNEQPTILVPASH